MLFSNCTKPNKKAKEPPSQRTKTAVKWTGTATTDEEALLVTRVWQKWRFSAPQTHLWLIKVWFSASTFVVKIATFAKPENVTANAKKTTTVNKMNDRNRKTTAHSGTFACPKARATASQSKEPEFYCT